MRSKKTALLTTAVALAASAVLAGSTTGFASTAPGDHEGDQPGRQDAYEVGLFGDMPYADFGRAQYPNVIDDMNRARLAFSVFDGDSKNGKEPCYADSHTHALSDQTPEMAVADATNPDIYKYALNLFGLFHDPVVYLPGDNDWTDCDRPKTLYGKVSDSNDRLAYERALYYPTDRSLGQRTIAQIRQSAAYPENVRWSRGPVTYIGLNIPGSDNNFAVATADGKLPDGPPAQGQAEYKARNAANLEWLRAGFDAAKAAHSKGVMIVIQADMWDPTATVTHFADTKAELARQSIAFDGKVILVNGDSHSFEMDKPLTDATTTPAGFPDPKVIENFTRVTTFGEVQNHWVSATVDPKDPNVFTFHQHLVTANLPTYIPPTPIPPTPIPPTP
ncbi:MAG: hypothetical protein H0V41_03575 [Pseudonocardiales bacterium]|nr:hypothetical protein [Pseudonocardiales bacterium]